MAEGSPLRMVRKCVQWIPKEHRNQTPHGTRGIYALHYGDHSEKNFSVVYIGMAYGNRGIKSRLAAHWRSKRKGPQWSHFSYFEVWPNVTDADIRELEGLLHEIYRKDDKVHHLLRQKRCKKLRNVRISKTKFVKGQVS
jgi:hypothetical protein